MPSDTTNRIPDALLIVSFGGPEKPEDVIPFLENVLRGRNVPRERMLAVAEHYYHFGGRSPINAQNRELIARLKEVLETEGPQVPIYWGNRNWQPFLADALKQMKEDGIRTAAAFITSAFGSYSGCRQYLEDIERARQEAGPDAPEVYRTPFFYDRPGFIDAMADHVRTAAGTFAAAPAVAFTAHSVPMFMAETGPYVEQLRYACGLIAEKAGVTDWKLVYQSRSGPPGQPWLEPDIGDHIRDLHSHGCRELMIVPVGFISDHMEVLYDLDTEAADLCKELGVRMARAKTAGTHPSFVRMIRDLLMEAPQICKPDCCPPPPRRVPATSGPAVSTIAPAGN